MAWMPRKSTASAPATFAARQVAPPSVVTSHVPPLPLAQTVRASTALTPRREARVLLIWGTQVCAQIATVKRKAGSSFIGFHHGSRLWRGSVERLPQEKNRCQAKARSSQRKLGECPRLLPDSPLTAQWVRKLVPH